MESIDVGFVRMAMVLLETTVSRCWIWSSMTCWRLVWGAVGDDRVMSKVINRISFMMLGDSLLKEIF